MGSAFFLFLLYFYGDFSQVLRQWEYSNQGVIAEDVDRPAVDSDVVCRFVGEVERIEVPAQLPGGLRVGDAPFQGLLRFPGGEAFGEAHPLTEPSLRMVCDV